MPLSSNDTQGEPFLLGVISNEAINDLKVLPSNGAVRNPLSKQKVFNNEAKEQTKQTHKCTNIATTGLLFITHLKLWLPVLSNQSYTWGGAGQPGSRLLRESDRAWLDFLVLLHQVAHPALRGQKNRKAHVAQRIHSLLRHCGSNSSLASMPCIFSVHSIFFSVQARTTGR